MVTLGLTSQVWHQVCELYDIPADASVTPFANGANRSYQLSIAGRARQVLRLYGHDVRPKWIVPELMVLQYLNQTADLRVPSPIPDRYGRLYATILEKDKSTPTPAAMFSFVSGETLSRTKPTSDVMFRIGQALGQLDIALQRADKAIDPSPSRSRPRQDGNRLIAWSLAQFAKHSTNRGFGCEGRFGKELHPIILQIGKRLRRNYRRSRSALPHQLLHADAHLDNLLFDGKTVGILDFGSMGYGPRLYELTAPLDSINGLEASGNQSTGPGSLRALSEALLTGYGSRIALSELELQSLSLFQALRHFVELGWHVSQQDVPKSKEWLEQRGAVAMERISALLDAHERTQATSRFGRTGFWVRVTAKGRR